MQQNLLLKLSVFTLATAIYLYMFDPSTKLFVSATKNLLELQFSFNDIFAVIAWLVGFLGIISFFNLKNNKLRTTFWIIFMISYSINFAYQSVFEQNFNLLNIVKFEEMFDHLEQVSMVKFLKFLIATVGFFILAKFLKPIGIDANKYFSLTLLTITIVTVVMYGNHKSLPMQVVYIVPFIILYGFILQLFNWLKLKLGFVTK